VALYSENLWLLETKLPDLHGLDVVHQLRAEGFKTPFIVISRNATVQGAVEATKSGALGVLEKPVRLDELRNIIGLITTLYRKPVDCQQLRGIGFHI
jgi:FixJ family two-component response regulator